MMSSAKILELRQQLLNGDTSQLETIYRELHSDIFSVLRSKRICSNDDLRDYFNQAILIFYDNILEGKITELKSLKNYLIGICLNQKRLKQTHRCRIDQKMEELKILFYENNDNTIDDLNYKSKLMDISKSAVKLLSDKCQKIIMGYYIHNWSMREVAVNLRLASGDVAKTLKSRCFKTLLKNVSEIQNEYQQ